MVWGRLFGFRGQVFVTTGRTTSGLVDAIELDYVALNRDFLFTTMGQLYRRLINILSYGHEEILYIINLIIQLIRL